MRIKVDASRRPNGFRPTVFRSIQAQLTWNGIAQGWITFGTSGHNPGDVYYLPLQAASPVASSGIYPWSVEVKATVGGTVYDRTVSGVQPVVVNVASSFGAGWSLGGIPSLLLGSTCVTSNSYDDAGNTLTSVNNLTQWVYDALDRKVQELDPLGNSEIYAYDALDRLTSTTDRNSQQIASSYDLLNRKTGETWYNANGTQVNALTFTFDADNNLQTAVNNAATTTMTYDALDRLATLSDSFGTTLTNTYDAADNRTQVQDSFGATTTRIYDVLNRIASLQLGGTGQTPLREDFTYTARDQVATQTRYSDLAGQNKIGSSTFGYDSVGRLNNLQHFDGSGNNIANYVNAFDLASRITSETLNGGAPTNYTYDVTNQLTDDSLVAYSYDLNGNRTMPGYTTGLANELTSDGIWNYFHDKNGNLVGKTNISTGETWNYGYDNRNRLISATQTTSVGLQMQATYVYDALGQRIEKDVTQSGVTTTTRFAYDRGEIWADLTSTNSLQTRYVRGERVLELLARIASGTLAWILANRMGSAEYVLDDTGAVIDAIAYDGYGKAVSETNPPTGGSYKAFGYRYDSETGLYRPDSSTGRYYNPLTGIWMGHDPISIAAQDVNPYRYVGNNPTNAIDQTGEETYFKLVDELAKTKNYKLQNTVMEAEDATVCFTVPKPLGQGKLWEKKQDVTGVLHWVISENSLKNPELIEAAEKGAVAKITAPVEFSYSPHAPVFKNVAEALKNLKITFKGGVSLGIVSFEISTDALLSEKKVFKRNVELLTEKKQRAFFVRLGFYQDGEIGIVHLFSKPIKLDDNEMISNVGIAVLAHN